MLSIHSNPIGDLGTNDTGGMSVYIRELARELGKRGHRIDIYTCLRDSRDRPVIDLSKNVRLIHLGIPNNGNLSRLALYPYLPDFFKSMENFRSHADIEYDLIHSHYWLSGRLGNMAQKLWNRPHFVMLHTLGEMKNRTGVGLPEPDLRIAAEKELVKTCHRILAPTDREKNNLVRYYGVSPEKIGVVPCGVNLDLFHPQGKKATRRKLGFDQRDIILLYVGRFEPLKGIDRLLEAMIHLRDHRRLRLIIVGGDGDESPESQFLRQKTVNLGIEDKVIFAGRIEQKHLPLYYSSADVLVMASHYESGRWFPPLWELWKALFSKVRQDGLSAIPYPGLWPMGFSRLSPILRRRPTRFTNPSMDTAGPMSLQQFSRNMKPQYGTDLLKTTAWCLREHVADNRNLSSEGVCRRSIPILFVLVPVPVNQNSVEDEYEYEYDDEVS